jgi:hypothetical protein
MSDDSCVTTALTLTVAICAALSTVLGCFTLIDRRRTRRRTVKIGTFVVHRPTDHGTPEVRLHIETTNLSEQAVGLRHWFLDAGTQRLAGSPYDGQATGDHLLQRNQLFGWTLEPETLRQIRPPARAIVTLTSGEAIDGGIVNWLLTLITQSAAVVRCYLQLHDRLVYSWTVSMAVILCRRVLRRTSAAVLQSFYYQPRA